MMYYMDGSHSPGKSANNGEGNLSPIILRKIGRIGMSTVSVKIQPLGDRVVVKASTRESVTKSGIVLPDTAKEKPQEGEILAVGPGKVLDNGKRVTLEVRVGQRVLFAKYAGTEVKMDGEEYLILRESDIMGVIE
jgi:chaperonin GroES